MEPLRIAFPRRLLTRDVVRVVRAHPQQQRRWARVLDVRFIATQPASERIFEKYREKLDRKAKEVGLRDSDELKRAYAEKKAQSSSPTPRPESSQVAEPPQSPSTPNSSAARSSQSLPPSPVSSPSFSSTTTPPPPPGIRTLSSFIDIPKFLSLPVREIEALWRLRHASSPHSVCATVPYGVYARMAATARRYPQFVLPLPREIKDDPTSTASSTSGTVQNEEIAARHHPKMGAEIHFLQWTFPTPDTTTVLFTHLAEYKARGEFAQPHTTVTHHLELARATSTSIGGIGGIGGNDVVDSDAAAADDGTGMYPVLLQGTVMPDRGVSVDDARALLYGLQKFYALETMPSPPSPPLGSSNQSKKGPGGVKDVGTSTAREELLSQFSRGDSGFSLQRVIDEVDKLV